MYPDGSMTTVLAIEPISTLIGALITGIGGSGVLIYYRYMTRRKEKDRLREALFYEIDNCELPSESEFNRRLGEEELYHSTPTSIYEAVGEDIALLSPDEVEAIVEFYSLLQVIDSILKSEEDLYRHTKRTYDEAQQLMEEMDPQHEEYEKMRELQLFFKNKVEETRDTGQAENTIRRLHRAQQNAKQELQAEHPNLRTASVPNPDPVPAA